MLDVSGDVDMRVPERWVGVDRRRFAEFFDCHFDTGAQDGFEFSRLLPAVMLNVYLWDECCFVSFVVVEHDPHLVNDIFFGFDVHIQAKWHGRFLTVRCQQRVDIESDI